MPVSAAAAGGTVRTGVVRMGNGIRTTISVPPKNRQQASPRGLDDGRSDRCGIGGRLVVRAADAVREIARVVHDRSLVVGPGPPPNCGSPRSSATSSGSRGSRPAVPSEVAGGHVSGCRHPGLAAGSAVGRGAHPEPGRPWGSPIGRDPVLIHQPYGIPSCSAPDHNAGSTQKHGARRSPDRSRRAHYRTGRGPSTIALLQSGDRASACRPSYDAAAPVQPAWPVIGCRVTRQPHT